MLFPGQCIDGESPPLGGGADGEGEAETPPAPVSCVSSENLSRWITTPTARPLRGLLPPPFRGGGQCLVIAPVAVPGSFSPETV